MKRRIKTYLIASSINLGIITVIFFAAGFKGLLDFSNLLGVSGILIMSAGVLSIFGNKRLNGDFYYRYVGAKNSVGRTEKLLNIERKTENKAYSFMGWAAAVGVLPLAVGGIIQYLVK